MMIVKKMNIVSVAVLLGMAPLALQAMEEGYNSDREDTVYSKALRQALVQTKEGRGEETCRNDESFLTGIKLGMSYRGVQVLEGHIYNQCCREKQELDGMLKERTMTLLTEIKTNHDRWVATRLAGQNLRDQKDRDEKIYGEVVKSMVQERNAHTGVWFKELASLAGVDV